MRYFFAFSIAFLIVYFLIPPLRKFALKVGFVDRPTERKIHKEPVPHLAGIGIFLGFICVYLAFLREINRKSISILIGAVLIIIIGVIDDWYKTHGKEFSALPKFIVQTLAAVIVFSAGIAFTGFNNPVTHTYILFPIWLQFIFSVLWIFGVTTVINFSDGLDGLAGSLSCISAVTLFIVATVKGQTDSALMAIILVGVGLAYLRYNKPPARIYMGDAGASF